MMITFSLSCAEAFEGRADQSHPSSPEQPEQEEEEEHFNIRGLRCYFRACPICDA